MVTVRKKAGPKQVGRPPGAAGDALLLDRFSRIDLETWKQLSESSEAYNVGLYYHLAKLRRLHHEELVAALRVAEPRSLHLSRWNRIVDYQYSLEPLSAAGSLARGGRFNIGRDLDPRVFPPFPALYMGQDYETSYQEKFGAPSIAGADGLTGADLSLRRPGSFTSVGLEGEIQQLFDLTTLAALRPFARIISKFAISAELAALAKRIGIKPPWLVTTPTKLRETLLAPGWRGMPAQFEVPANSQIIGRLLIEAGFEGILYPSSKGKGLCIALFPEVLINSESYVELSDPAPAHLGHRRLDSTTCQALLEPGD